MKTVADLIAAQNKLTDLKKRVRDAQNSRKYPLERLADIKKDAGYFAAWKPEDVQDLKARSEAQVAECDAKIATLQEKLAPLEAAQSERQVAHPELLAFFQGNNQEAARNALEVLALCEEHGNWLPGASRRVEAAINPAKVSKKADRAAFDALYAPLKAQFAKWTATRPAPTFTSLGVSPTVTATLESLKAESFYVCPMEFVEVEVTNPETNKKSWKTIIRLLWPEGTLHGTSRYSTTNNNMQCQACGHAIKNAFNWVPMVLNCTDGKKRSLWVGRDCAKNLFNVEVTGEVEIEGR